MTFPDAVHSEDEARFLRALARDPQAVRPRRVQCSPHVMPGRAVFHRALADAALSGERHPFRLTRRARGEAGPGPRMPSRGSDMWPGSTPQTPCSGGPHTEPAGSRVEATNACIRVQGCLPPVQRLVDHGVGVAGLDAGRAASALKSARRRRFLNQDPALSSGLWRRRSSRASASRVRSSAVTRGRIVPLSSV